VVACRRAISPIVGPGTPGDLRDPSRWILPHSLHEAVEAHGVLWHELLVVEALLDDHVQHSQSQRRIRPRPHLRPHVCLRDRLRTPGIDNDHLRAIAPGEVHLDSTHAVG
jgi:hypothetical protein